MAKGYTPINNEFFSKLIEFDLSGADYKVLLHIYRNTVFYKRLEQPISYSHIEKGLNYSVSRPQIIRSVKKLNDIGLIKVKKASGSKPQSIQIRVLNFDKPSTQFWLPTVINFDNSRVIKNDNQENKEIKDKENKEKEKGFSFDFSKDWESMNQEDFDD